MIVVRGLRGRFLVAFAAFGALLTTVFGIGAWQAMQSAEDALLDRRLALLEEHVARLRADDPTARLPEGPFAWATTDAEALPAPLRRAVADRDPGAYSVDGGGGDHWRLRVAVLPGGERLYLYLNETEQEVTEGLEHATWPALAGLCVLVALPGVGVGVATTRRVIDPLVRLTDAVAAHTADDPPPDLQAHVSDDELGVLAEQLEQAMGRVAAAARQEQLFGRYTSHELRSSLSVIRGVAELLGAVDEPRLARPVGRLDRASRDMADIIETCLWLARTHGQPLPSEAVELRPLADELAAALQGRTHPGVRLSVEVPEALVVQAPPQAVRMVLRNLLTNAARHTETGTIDLVADADAVTVRDTGPGIPTDVLPRITEAHVRGPGGGHGLGLSIVHGLCVRLGWRFAVQREVGVGTVARVRFASAEDAAEG